MVLHTPPVFGRSVRQTLRWLLDESFLEQPRACCGESRRALFEARRLHESLRRLPPVRGRGRCLVVGSRGLEVPYLCGRLGWADVTCLCPPADGRFGTRRGTRRRPGTDEHYTFTLIEREIDAGPLPFDDGTFSLVLYWRCLEHLRRDPELSLYELHRVCEPGALLSLVTANPISLQATDATLRGRPLPLRLEWPTSQGEWRLYAPSEVEDLLRGTGWRVDLLTSIVPACPPHWSWWKRALFKSLVARQRRGLGLSEPYWNSFVLAHATKTGSPTRSYPAWLYKDEQRRRLKVDMLELVARRDDRLADTFDRRAPSPA